MPDYKALYFALLRAHSQAIELLTAAGLAAEEAALGDNAPPIALAGPAGAPEPETNTPTK